MRHLATFAALAFAAGVPVRALDISGNVFDKLSNPIEGAKVCIKSDPNTCVTTDADGAFHLAKAIAVRNPGTGDAGFSLAYRRGSLIVRSPSAVAARLEWLSAEGRRAWAAADVKLAAGANALALPAGLPRAGLVILRLSTPDHILAWKAFLASGASAPGPVSSGAPRIAALSKAAAATLEISKTGYRTRTYDPAAETETDVTILLSEISDVGIEFTGSLNEKVIAIDHSKKTIVTETVDAYCDSGTSTKVLHDTAQDTSNYVVRDGKLWTWTTGDCTGTMFTGTASDIVGKWTLVDPNALLPDDLRAGCVPDSSGGESPFETYSADYNVSETQITGTLTAETCPGDYFGYIFAYAFAQDTTVVPTKNTCKEISFTNGKGETATFDFSKNGDSLHTAYAYKNTPCAFDMDFSLSQKDPVCPEGQDMVGFLTCVAGTGFAKTNPVAKVSARVPARLPMSLERRAPPGLAKLPKSGWLAPLRNAGRGEEYISRIWKAAPPRK